MAFISVFDVLGPNMIGPSSSHTAGAAAIAFLARKMIAPPIVKVEFTLYGSFAKTYRGHGTDRALVAGVLGLASEDVPVPVDGKFLGFKCAVGGLPAAFRIGRFAYRSRAVRKGRFRLARPIREAA